MAPSLLVHRRHFAKAIAPKLLDFYDLRDPRSSPEVRVTRQYIEEFRQIDLERAVQESDLGRTRDGIETLNVPAVARYAFQVGGANLTLM